MQELLEALIIPTKVVDPTIFVCTRTHNGLIIKMGINILLVELYSMVLNTKLLMISSLTNIY